jgi:hypothetical protein
MRQKGSGSTDPIILKTLALEGDQQLSFMPQQLYLWERNPNTNQIGGWGPALVWSLKRREIPLLLAGIVQQFPICPAQSV